MLDLARAVARNPLAGEPLPLPWEKLARLATPRRAQIAMVYGPSGSFKSGTALNWILELRLPTLYVSADTDQHDMAFRTVCRRRQETLATVEYGVQTGSIDMGKELADLEWLRFSFDPSPTLDDLELELLAFTEQFGAPPEVVVIDTLTDVDMGDEDEFRGMRRVMAALHHVARTTGALVLVLHHTTGEYDDVTSPAPRRGINGKLSKVPELILSTAISGKDLGFAVVKQRSGYQDKRAENPVWLRVDAATYTISNPEHTFTPDWSYQ